MGFFSLLYQRWYLRSFHVSMCISLSYVIPVYLVCKYCFNPHLVNGFKIYLSLQKGNSVIKLTRILRWWVSIYSLIYGCDFLVLAFHRLRTVQHLLNLFSNLRHYSYEYHSCLLAHVFFIHWVVQLCYELDEVLFLIVFILGFKPK